MKAVPKGLYTLAFSSRVRLLQTKFTFGLKPNTYRIHWQIGQGYFYLDQPIIQGFIGKVKKLLHLEVASILEKICWSKSTEILKRQMIFWI